MLTLLWKAISGHKLLTYGVLAIMFIAIAGTAIATVFGAGKRNERAKQLEDALSSLKKEYKRRAEVDAMSAADARRKLRERWRAQ